MKTKFLLTFLVLFSMFSLSYASFPVHRTANVNLENVSLQEDSDSVTMESPAAGAANKEMIVALLLWFFLGGLAGHRWYLGSPIGWNILFIFTLGGLGIWWIIDGIDIITEKYPGL